jgi:GntR family transcriptional regulator/MocR family aminotransferase
VLEDDYDSEFRYGGPPLPCLQGLDRAGRCLYAGSVSKLLHPALRAGYLIVPPALVNVATAAKSTLDQATTPLVQEALADFFASGEIERHLRRAGRAYRARRARLLAALAATPLPGAAVWPVTGGLHAFVSLPGVPPALLARHAAQRGLALTRADDCYQAEPAGTALILWFSRIPPERIAPGIAALAGAVAAARWDAENVPPPESIGAAAPRRSMEPS